MVPKYGSLFVVMPQNADSGFGGTASDDGSQILHMVKNK